MQVKVFALFSQLLQSCESLPHSRLWAQKSYASRGVQQKIRPQLAGWLVACRNTLPGLLPLVQSGKILLYMLVEISRGQSCLVLYLSCLSVAWQWLSTCARVCLLCRPTMMHMGKDQKTTSSICRSCQCERERVLSGKMMCWPGRLRGPGVLLYHPFQFFCGFDCKVPSAHKHTHALTQTIY